MFICPVCNRLHPLSPKQPVNPFPHSSSLLATMSVLYMHAILKIICINSNSSNEYCLICFPPKDLFIYESNFWRNWEIETDTCTLLTVCTTWSTDGSMLHPQGPALNTLRRPRWSGATMSSQKSVSMVLYPQIQSTADHEDCKKYALEKKKSA